MKTPGPSLEGGMMHVIGNGETRPGSRAPGSRIHWFQKGVFFSEPQQNVCGNHKKTKSYAVWIQMFFTNLDKVQTHWFSFPDHKVELE